MKKILFMLVISCNAFAQEDGPMPLTPAIKQRIAKEISEQLVYFEKTCVQDGFLNHEIAFMKDTFRINNTMKRSIDFDYSTHGMNEAMLQAYDAYDSLLNVYYNKLLSILDLTDKKILVQAQKAWILFRDNEKKLIGLLGNEKYSGGGTIQSNFANASYLQVVETRVINLFQSYSNCTSTSK
jgi:uncharacterized protein YecT (DUF1311 family)